MLKNRLHFLFFIWLCDVLPSNPRRKNVSTIVSLLRHSSISQPKLLGVWCESCERNCICSVIITLGGISKPLYCLSDITIICSPHAMMFQMIILWRISIILCLIVHWVDVVIKESLSMVIVQGTNCHCRCVFYSQRILRLHWVWCGGRIDDV
jgi:hypothetical protein